MSNLTAALIRSQMAELDQRCRRWNERYDLLAKELENVVHLRLPKRHPKEGYVGSSLQFSLTDTDVVKVGAFLKACAQRGVEIKWFGAAEPKGFTSSWESWQYVETLQSLPATKNVLKLLCDFRIPLTFTLDDCKVIAAVIRQAAEDVYG